MTYELDEATLDETTYVTVFRDNKNLGLYWELGPGTFAAFKTEIETPIAYPGTEADCIRPITDGAWDGKGWI
ncbi:MAG TPA: hypothetical protein VFG15_03320 [Amycolatopsis sp.]|nr:hypothetical protein [Amycolatopsis sp.]